MGMKQHCDQCDKIIMRDHDVKILIKDKQGQAEFVFCSRQCAANHILEIPYTLPAQAAN